MTFEIITVIILYIEILCGGIAMEKKSKLGWIIFIVSAVAAITAAVTAFLVVKEKKKKNEAELEEYLDCSIQ